MNWLSNIVSEKTNQEQDNLALEIPLFLEQIRKNDPISIERQTLGSAKLKEFVPLRNLDDKNAALVSHSIATYAPNSTIFVLGQNADSVHYLLQGEIKIHPNVDNSYDIVAGTGSSFLPLNSGKKFGSTAVAVDEVKILQVFADLEVMWDERIQDATSSYEICDFNLPNEISNNRFFESFTESYKANKLQLPSLPDVIFKLQEAMKQDIGVIDAAKIIQTDASIVSKLVQVANSPLYATGIPISNCVDAINRLGLEATRNLTIGIGLKEAFLCKDVKLKKYMHSLWENSLEVSCLSFVLAEQSKTVNPDTALLAGLISDIGIIPLLSFADRFPDQYPDFELLEQAIPHLRGPVGALVMHTLGFSEELSRIPEYAESWYYESGSELTLTDIVILAKLHSYICRRKTKGLPYINSIPAYSKLSDDKLDTDFSLNILGQAKQRIKASMNLLS